MRNDRLAIRVAMRYLWSRKSHSAVTAIAIAGVCGVAIATMAIVCVLSVFNGFNEAILGRDTHITPDIRVSPSRGAIIANADSLAQVIAEFPGTKAVTPVVEDEAVAYYNGHQFPVQVLGVKPDEYRVITDIDSITISGKWKPQPQEIIDNSIENDEDAADTGQISELAEQEFDETALFAEETLTAETIEPESLPISSILISTGVASNLSVPPLDETGMIFFVPRRTGKAYFTDPASVFMVDSLAATGVFASGQSEFDASTVIMELNTARRLLEYDTQANSLFIALKPGINPVDYKEALQSSLGNGYKVNMRSEQQGIHFRMIAIEKWITFLMLAFILIIASFNIISTLSMLIIEKRHNILTMTSYGASRGFIGKVFFWESVIVCLSGSVAGLLTGTLLCFLQMQFGFISMPSVSADMIITTYPVKISIADLGLITALSVAVALLTAAVSASYAIHTASQKRNKILT